VDLLQEVASRLGQICSMNESLQAVNTGWKQFTMIQYWGEKVFDSDE
jgi:hypothetical protein